MWKLVIEDDQGSSTTVQLAGREYGIGRAEDNTIRLTDRNISRHHARLVRKGNEWSLEDRASYNGCFVNGARTSTHHKLSHGDLIQLGDYKLELINEDPSLRSRPKDTGRLALLGQPDRLVMLVGPDPGAEYPLTDKTTFQVGRGDECDIRINHASVSRIHMELRRLETGGFEAIDCRSANGLRVNGVELERGLLDGRDTLELGDVTLKYIKAGAVYVPNAAELRRISGAQPGGVSSTLPAPARFSKAPLPVRLAAAATGGVVLLLLGLIAFGGDGDAPDPAGISATPGGAQDDATRLLDQATKLAASGQVEEAHRLVSTIPTDHSARESRAFQELEAEWADRLFSQAQSERDRERKRALLERLVAARTVDEGRRLRAEKALQALTRLTAEVHDLGMGDPLAAAPAVGGGPEGTAATPTETQPSRGSAPSRHGGSTSRPPTPKTTPKPTAPEPAAPQVLTAEERAKLTRMKEILKSKAAVGTLSAQDARRLKSLCQKLGDASCS